MCLGSSWCRQQQSYFQQIWVLKGSVNWKIGLYRSTAHHSCFLLSQNFFSSCPFAYAYKLLQITLHATTKDFETGPSCSYINMWCCIWPNMPASPKRKLVEWLLQTLQYLFGPRKLDIPNPRSQRLSSGQRSSVQHDSDQDRRYWKLKWK